jgi:hypothetical protein
MVERAWRLFPRASSVPIASSQQLRDVLDVRPFGIAAENVKSSTSRKSIRILARLLAEKMAEKLDVSASKSTSGIILEPSKVKEATKTSDIKMSSKEAASESTKLKVEVLSSSENEPQKPVPQKADNAKKSPVPQPASKTSKAEEPKPKQHDEVKVSEIGVVKDPAEGPVNKLEELD